MKRLIAIPLLILYLTAMSGAMVQIHYCGNEVTSWTVNDDSEKGCCCESKDGIAGNDLLPKIKKTGCCSDKTFTLKVSEAQSNIISATGFLADVGEGIVTLPELPEHTFNIAAEEKSAHNTNAPPGRWQNIPLYKLHSSFTYYG